MRQTAALETKEHFRKIVGHEELWMLKAVPDEGPAPREQADSGPLDETTKPVDEEWAVA